MYILITIAICKYNRCIMRGNKLNSPFIVIFCSPNGASPLTGAIQYSTPCIISPGRDHPVSVLFYIDVSPRTCLHCNAEVFQEWQVVQVSSMFPRYSDMLWITIYGYIFLVVVVALIFFFTFKYNHCYF